MSYLLDKHHGIHFEVEAIEGQRERALHNFVDDVLQNTICDGDPNGGTLHNGLVDNHCCTQV